MSGWALFLTLLATYIAGSFFGVAALAVFIGGAATDHRPDEKGEPHD